MATLSKLPLLLCSKPTKLEPCPRLSKSRSVRKVRASAGNVDSFDPTQQRFLNLIKETPSLRRVAATTSQEVIEEEVSVNESSAPFETMKNRFLTFKQEKFSKKPDVFSKLSAGQSPKFMVIACADSRVCPSTILGFQPGEAFMIRNVANMVPPFKEEGFPATGAALEYAALHLKVENIFVIGHSRCGGIKAIMSMAEEEGPKSSDFIEDWVTIAKPARSRTKSVAAQLPFDDQCTQCEKESVNQSLSNLLTYPWIKDLVSQGKLFLHGGYYNFVDCSFEQWTLSYKEGETENVNQAITNRSVWC
uniref:Carbonic anhydrase n=1 Tax=Araucaria cunninghamii TaxID=56994 RepID=A0A0D6R581_ARACU